MKMERVESPCIRNCCLDNHDICLGCHRHIDEITGWQSFTSEQKLSILKRCNERKIEVKRVLNAKNGRSI